MWLLCMFIGSMMLTALWFFQRTEAMGWGMWATRIAPIVLVSDVFFWAAIRRAPSFVAARYTMSAMTHTLGLILAFAILHEECSWQKVAGIALIIGGSILVRG